MTLVMVGASHRTAPFGTLERLALPGAVRLGARAALADSVDEVVSLVTCNRVELYVETQDPLTATGELRRVLEGLVGEPLGPVLTELTGRDAHRHLCEVAAGLQSLAIGESQILGQVRLASAQARESETIGPALERWFQEALRVAKSVRRATELDQVAPSVVSLALDRVPTLDGSQWADRSAAILGAGAMAAVVAYALRARGCAELTIYNRSSGRANDLAEAVDASARPMAALAHELSRHDVVISCTGSPQVQLDASLIEAHKGPLTLIDLALPHDIDPGVGRLAPVTLITLADLTTQASPQLAARLLDAADILTRELAELALADARSERVIQTRARMQRIVDEETLLLLDRLDLPERELTEVRRALRRAAGRLMHASTTQARMDGQGLDHDSVVDALRASLAESVSA